MVDALVTGRSLGRRCRPPRSLPPCLRRPPIGPLPGSPAGSVRRPSISSTLVAPALLAIIGSWVTTTRLRPCSTVRARSRVRTMVELAWSRAPVGSSAKTTDGSATSARAMATRCCSPPDRSSGAWSMRSARPTMVNSSQARSRVEASDRPSRTRGMATFSQALRPGRSRNDWNTKPKRARRSPARASSVRWALSTPVDEQGAPRWPVDEAEQLEEGRLARAAAPADGDQLTGGHLE